MWHDGVDCVALTDQEMDGEGASPVNGFQWKRLYEGVGVVNTVDGDRTW